MCRRGEVWLVDLGMAAKVRPCLVLSTSVADADRALVTLVPHTTSCRGSQFEVSTQLKFLRPGAFDAQNLVTIPTVKLLRKLGRLSAGELQSVEKRFGPGWDSRPRSRPAAHDVRQLAIFAALHQAKAGSPCSPPCRAWLIARTICCQVVVVLAKCFEPLAVTR